MGKEQPRLKMLRLRIPTADTFRVPMQPGATNPDSWRAGRRGSTARLYDYRWQRESKQFLAEHPLCMCPQCDEGRKRTTVADVVDHHRPHRGDPVLFWDKSNWRSMAKRCHDRKTARGG